MGGAFGVSQYRAAGFGVSQFRAVGLVLTNFSSFGFFFRWCGVGSIGIEPGLTRLKKHRVNHWAICIVGLFVLVCVISGWARLS